MTLRTKIRVCVLESDIEEGQRRDYARCPIALAIQGRLDRKDVKVDYDGAIVSGEWFDLPKSCNLFMSLFDQGCVVRPFSFTMTKYVARNRPT